MVITLNIEDAKASELVTSFANKYDYNRNQLPGETKNQFAKRKVIEYIQEVHAENIRRTAFTAAAANILVGIDTSIDVQ
jgi:hypothetical protein